MLSQNQSNDTIRLTGLPHALQGLDLAGNSLEGFQGFTQLTISIEEILLHRDALSRTIDLDNIPPHLERLYVFGNILNGIVRVLSSVACFELGATW